MASIAERTPVVADTPEAVEQFNTLRKTQTVIGAFHLM